jgi:hypothetical protein
MTLARCRLPYVSVADPEALGELSLAVRSCLPATNAPVGQMQLDLPHGWDGDRLTRTGAGADRTESFDPHDLDSLASTEDCCRPAVSATGTRRTAQPEATNPSEICLATGAGRMGQRGTLVRPRPRSLVNPG